MRFTLAEETRVFLVLVPHRDIRLALRKYSDMLFKAKFTGSYHFPWVAPLAAISRPLSTEELKHCARSIREAAGGKILAHEAAAASFPAGEGTLLFGPRLDLSILPDSLGGGESAAKITSIFSPPVIGSCLLSSGECETSTIPSPAPLSSRAAAVANMIWRPLRRGGTVIGYKWKIGKLIWLPPVRKD